MDKPENSTPLNVPTEAFAAEIRQNDNNPPVLDAATVIRDPTSQEPSSPR